MSQSHDMSPSTGHGPKMLEANPAPTKSNMKTKLVHQCGLSMLSNSCTELKKSIWKR